LGGTLLISEEVPQVLCGLRGLCGECLEAAAATNPWWQPTSKVQRNARSRVQFNAFTAEDAEHAEAFGWDVAN
jgi:hypothetical protein